MRFEAAVPNRAARSGNCVWVQFANQRGYRSAEHRRRNIAGGTSLGGTSPLLVGTLPSEHRPSLVGTLSSFVGTSPLLVGTLPSEHRRRSSEHCRRNIAGGTSPAERRSAEHRRRNIAVWARCCY
jgi:hypothetical protein